MSVVRVVFLGTPQFAIPCLDQLIKDSHFEVVGVVTQPDRPSGRKMKVQPCPVKERALACGLRVISPEKISEASVLSEIQSWGAESAVVVAYGQILPQAFFDSFPRGSVNVHASLLPRWRGAAPIQRSIEMGDTKTGVSLQVMVKELDAGDVLGERTTPLTDDKDAKLLHDELSQLGAELLHVEYMDYLRGNLMGLAQDPSAVTYAKKIAKSEGLIEWSESSRKLFNKVRAFAMGPGTWTHYQGKKIKIHQVSILSDQTGGAPGEILSVDGETLEVATGDGSVSLEVVQPESRPRMKIRDFLQGHSLKKGEVFRAS